MFWSLEKYTHFLDLSRKHVLYEGCIILVRIIYEDQYLRKNILVGWQIEPELTNSSLREMNSS